jgi:hypothetical protein
MNKFLWVIGLWGILAFSYPLLIANEHDVRTGSASSKVPRSAFDFPTIPSLHGHVRALAENAMAFLKTITEPHSGYPFEGWNHDPNGMDLHKFTQLTAIGEWLEILSEIVAGNADSPYLSRQQALKLLRQAVTSLLKDQADPELSVYGLLYDFPFFEGKKRQVPLSPLLFKQDLLDKFGASKGNAIWSALANNDWITPKGDSARIERIAKLRHGIFDGALAPYGEDPTKSEILALLDQRLVKVSLGDNVNLSASVAKAIGALLSPQLPDRPEIAQIREDLDKFLDRQKEGYQELIDSDKGLFYFGLLGRKGRYPGGEKGAAHHDYLINEFRNPLDFVVSRFHLNKTPLKNLGIRIGPYRMPDGSNVYTVKPYSGSFFQAVGLGVFPDLKESSWHSLLNNSVAAESDYCTQKGIPGFLSESYRRMNEYTGDTGIPALAVTDEPRFRDASSLYTLGVAYHIAPEKVESFLAAQWPIISQLRTSHGPWEGYSLENDQPIRVQTTAHTLSLLLGLIGTGGENMERYLKRRGVSPKSMYPRGTDSDWLENSKMKTESGIGRKDQAGGPLTIDGEKDGSKAPTVRLELPKMTSVANGNLVIEYKSDHPIDQAEIVFLADQSPSAEDPHANVVSKKAVLTRLEATSGETRKIEVPLPPIWGLTDIKSLSIKLTPSRGNPVHVEVVKLNVIQNQD